MGEAYFPDVREAGVLLFNTGSDAAQLDVETIEESGFPRAIANHIERLETAGGGVGSVRSVEVRGEKARLFGKDELHWGVLTSEIAPTTTAGQSKSAHPLQTFLFVIDEVKVDLKKTEAYAGIASGRGQLKTMQQAFFFDGTEMVRQEQEIQDALFRHLFLNTLLVLLNVTVIVSLFLIFRIKEIAKKMTDKIIWVYETLEHVIRSRKQDKS